MTGTSHPFDRHLAKKRRILAGLTLSAFADRMASQGHEVHLSAISKVEVGTNHPSAALLVAMARALECGVEDLCRKADEAGAA